jgi:hypothetical protein
MNRAQWDPRDPRWERWSTASGVVFVVLAVLAYLFAPGVPQVNDSDAEVLDWFADNDSRIRWQVFLFGLATIFFLWFFATLAGQLRRAAGTPGGRLPAIIVASAGASAALFMAGTASFGTVARMAPDTDRTLFELGNMIFTVNEFVALTLVAAVSISVLRTGLLPDWLAWAGGVFVVLALLDAAGRTIGDSDAFGPGGVFGTLTFLVFLGWTLAASLLLWQATPLGLDRVDVAREHEAAPGGGEHSDVGGEYGRRAPS